MSWWQKLTGREKQKEQSQTLFPIKLDLIPGRLTAHVYLKEFGSLQGTVTCWTYVTNGLWALKQKELIFSLQRGREEKIDRFPDDPLKFFITVFHLAEQGRYVNIGDITEFTTSIFLGHKGVMYIAPDDSHNLELEAPALVAILLSDQELEAIKRFGPTRVIARLGDAYEYYPCPPWSDRMRPTLSFEKAFSESILNQVPRLRGHGFRVRLDNKRILLRLLVRAGDELVKKLVEIPPSSPFALLTEIDSGANGCYVWDPERGTGAIVIPASDASRLSGCFIVLVPGHSEDRGLYTEDGFVMYLTDESWSALRHALETHNTISISASNEGMGFALEWIPVAYQNPFDSTVLYSEGGMDVFIPSDSSTRKLGAIERKDIFFFIPPNDLGKYIPSESFGGYLDGVDKILQTRFATLPVSSGQELLIQFDISPTGAVGIKMASYPGINDEILQDIYSNLMNLQAPRVISRPIKFHCNYAIWGGPATSEFSKFFKIQEAT